MGSILGWSGELGRRNGPLPKGNPYFSRLASSLVYSCMSPVVYPLLASHQSLPSQARWGEHVKPLGAVLSHEPCLGGSPLPQPRVLGFVPHDSLV